MWNCAFRAIQQARLLVFIGYSLPPSDGFMRAMIQGAISASEESPKIWVVNPFPDESARKQYTGLFPSLKDEPKRIVTSTFAEAWQEGILQEILEGRTGLSG